MYGKYIIGATENMVEQTKKNSNRMKKLILIFLVYANSVVNAN